ncbi:MULTISPECIES: acyl carrier protein [Actinosynnema]|uniref:Acyl-carrier protein n=3 Tax=Actinosynnema TaxID=40566 RepID=C6WMR5_ACTMD|nr:MULTISPECIES: acyl carrier protein [Actinosynnema]ACU36594.1 acyl-carrier protein [Actinosynnema mirum DSM 43827]ATE54176.1 acyl carrier protein [Actinosynnema pretiosum]MCP2092308.1 Acyl carrier protein [Actinosynnema pretiosum]QUF05777.1 acyl carrier protein [Actinosynnema pretiosum subsp. pretiosum]
MSEVAEAVLEILSDVLEVSRGELRATPVLAAHEWDSTSSLDALSQLETGLGVRVDLRAFHAARTVADVVDLVSPQFEPV